MVNPMWRVDALFGTFETVRISLLQLQQQLGCLFPRAVTSSLNRIHKMPDGTQTLCLDALFQLQTRPTRVHAL